MRGSGRLSIASAIWLATFARADIAYVTDLAIFSLLAPCASDAVSNNINILTYSTSACGDSEKALQSCVCSDKKQFASITSSISSSVGSSCGTTGTDDQQSASKVVELYCNQALTITFSTPTKNIVQAYITDLSQMQYLPQCAQSALSEAVMGNNLSKCPQAASLFAPCVCTKEGIPASVSDQISKSVRYSCSNGDDITVAQDFYNEYCAMNNGTTTFTSPPGPPGSMTYHVTALSQFKALRSCAQSGVASAVLEQTELYCATGPMALASCVCLKSGMSGKVSSTLTSYVKWNCDNTATADVTSALAVLDFYCSAAENKVVVSVSETATESYPHVTRSSKSGPSSPAQTSSGGGNGTEKNGSDGSTPANDKGNAPGVNKTVVIVACVIGVVVVIAAVGVIGFIIRRKRQKQTKGEQLPPTNDGPGNNYDGPPELENTDKMGPAHVAAISELGTPGRQELQGNVGAVSELPPTYQPHRPELHGNGDFKFKPSPTPPQELASPAVGYYPPPSPLSRTQQGTPVVSPATPNTYGAGWQAGPVVEAYELESTTWKGH